MLALFSRLIFRDLWKNKTFSILFILTMSMGMMGFVFIHYFKASMEGQMSARSKDILGSDLSLGSRRAITDSERSKTEKILGQRVQAKYDILEMYSMLYVGDRSKLVDLKTLPDQYPFYGHLLLSNGQKYNSHFSKLDGIYIDHNLANLLTLKVGDKVKLGEMELPVLEIVNEDSSQAVIGFSLGPRIYLRPEVLAKTALVRPGSTIRYSTHYLLKNTDAKMVQILKDSMTKLFDDPGIRIKTHVDASEDLARATTRFNDFLALVSIVSLFLAGIGSQFLFRNFLLRHLRVTGLLNTLGWNKKTILSFYMIELSFLSLLSFATSVLLILAIMPLLSWWVKSKFDLTLVLDGQQLMALILTTFWIGPVLSLSLSLPLLKSLLDLQVSRLFHGRLLFDKMPWKKGLILYIPSLILFYSLSVYESGSLMVGSLFFVLLFLSIVIIALFLQFLFWVGEKFTHNISPFWRLPFLYLKRNRVSTLSYFLALGLGTLLMTLVPTLERTIREEITTPGKSTVPNLFLFDIQTEQLPELERLLQLEGQKLSFKSPLVRGRLMKINGKEHQYKSQKSWFKTREEESKEKLTNRVLNFSYRQNFSDAESIVEGRPFLGQFTWASGKPVEVSLEKRFAENYNIKIGDQLDFDVQDVEIHGVVVSLRTVKWLSFQPNFFIQFQPGALDDAPKTFLAAINSLRPEEAILWQNKIGAKFSNISLIDVRDSLGKITKLMEQMGVGLRIMAMLCIFVGFLVIYSLSQSSVFERLPSFNIFKVLGLSERKVLEMVLMEYGVVSFFATSMGLILSMLVSGILSFMLFERAPIFPWATVLFMVGGITILSLLISFISIQRLLREKPSILLRELASQS
ncbi:MAG: ABC transporter permease [Bacteriovoracaceae bacterium]